MMYQCPIKKFLGVEICLQKILRLGEKDIDGVKTDFVDAWLALHPEPVPRSNDTEGKHICSCICCSQLRLMNSSFIIHLISYMQILDYLFEMVSKSKQTP